MYVCIYYCLQGKKSDTGSGKGSSHFAYTLISPILISPTKDRFVSFRLLSFTYRIYSQNAEVDCMSLNCFKKEQAATKFSLAQFYCWCCTYTTPQKSNQKGQNDWNRFTSNLVSLEAFQVDLHTLICNHA